MNLEDLKREFDTEDRRRAERLAREMGRLKTVIKKKDVKISKMRKTLMLVCSKCHDKNADDCWMCKERWICNKIRQQAEEEAGNA